MATSARASSRVGDATPCPAAAARLALRIRTASGVVGKIRRHRRQTRAVQEGTVVRATPRPRAQREAGAVTTRVGVELEVRGAAGRAAMARTEAGAWRVRSRRMPPARTLRAAEAEAAARATRAPRSTRPRSVERTARRTRVVGRDAVSRSPARPPTCACRRVSAARSIALPRVSSASAPSAAVRRPFACRCPVRPPAPASLDATRKPTAPLGAVTSYRAATRHACLKATASSHDERAIPP